MKQVLLILYFIFCIQATAMAQSERPKAVPVAAANDRSSVVLRQPKPQRLENYRNRREYDYSQDVAPPDNPVARLWAWFMEKLGSFLRSKSYDDFWQYVILAFVASVVLWLAWKSEFLGNMFGTTPKNALEYESLTENIHELNFADLIEQAVEQRNYRLAVRLYYLKTLKQLTDKNLIDWQPTKTNRSYLRELAVSPLSTDFEEITQQFEYVWYGDFPVSEPIFEELKEQFQQFLSRI
jgi:Domain of unknown function (DUF4129)